MRVLLVGQDDTLPGGMPVYIRSLRDYLTTRPSIDVRYLNETAVKGRRDMERPSGPALFGEGMRLRRALRQEIAEFAPHVVHLQVAHGLSVLEKAALARLCAVMGKPAVLHMHGAGLMEGLSRLPNPVRRWLSHSAPPPHRVVALSPSTGRALSTAFPNWSVHVIPNAVEPPATAPPLPAAFTVGFLGFMDGRKGEQDLVRAIATCPAPIQAVLAGDGPNLESVRREAERLGLTDRVRFLGRIGGEAKMRFFSDISALCLPSYAENYPIALLEAMSYGRTVLASSVGGVPDLVTPQHNGWLFAPGDVQGLSSALAEAARSAILVANFGAQSRATVDSGHVWSVVGPLVEQVYAGAVRDAESSKNAA